MKSKFSPSRNILRDTISDINYLPTPNAKKASSQLVNDFKKGIRAFTLIGTYGTGKSSFLLALEQSLAGINPYFQANFIDNCKFKSIKIVGSYDSIIDAFATYLDLNEKNDLVNHILTEIVTLHNGIDKKAPFLLIEIDEFGKFLEYAAKHNSERELYFLQQLAELVSDPKFNIALITTIHQSFESYAFGLSPSQKQEWNKIKGRFREIVFNEPVEQLLYLSAQYLESSAASGIELKVAKNILQLFKKSKAFATNDVFSEEINNKIFPLEPFSAHILTLGIQEYGQNERSLFSFLESTDHTSINRFKSNNSGYYNLHNVYEYFNFNFYNLLKSRHNPHFADWTNIRDAIDRVQTEIEKDTENAVRIVEAIGLLNIFSSAGANLDKSILSEYSRVCMGIKNPEILIDQLTTKGIIRFRKHSKRYVIFEGTDLDIDAALLEVSNRVSEITDIRTALQRHFILPPVLAKKYSYQNGTPRYFKYKITENPLSEIDNSETDGVINLIFNDSIKLDTLILESKKSSKAILFAYFLNSVEIKNLLFEIDKTQQVLADNTEDKAAKKEIENILIHQKNLLNLYVMSNLFNGSENVKWIYNGSVVSIKSARQLNNWLTSACELAYNNAPVFRLELVNRNKLSGQIHTAKKNLFKALTENWALEDLGFEKDKYPAEKTIFYSLLKINGIDHYSRKNQEEISIEEGSSFFKLWQACNEFVDSTRDGKRNLGELIDILRKEPFGLKAGFIQIWIPIFLFLKRNDFALFHEDSFIPDMSDETMDLISRDPYEYEIKAFDLDGVKLEIFNSYRLFLTQDSQEKITKQSFIETIKPFLSFYRALPEYAKTTRRVNKAALKIRAAIANSKDPEKTFFEDFPDALGTTIELLHKDKKNLAKYTEQLQSSIKELRTAFDNLVERFEKYIQIEIVNENIAFEGYQSLLQKRYKGVKSIRLSPELKVLLSRINSQIDDRTAWLNSLAQSVIPRPFEKFTDEDEEVLHDRLKSMLSDLEAFNTLSKENVDESKEDVLGLRLDSFADGIRKSVLRIPKNKTKQIDGIKEDVRNSLGKDKMLNIAALAKLLEELIKK